MLRSCFNGSLLFLILTSNDLVYSFKALSTCLIIVLGAGIGFLVLEAGFGVSSSSLSMKPYSYFNGFNLG